VLGVRPWIRLAAGRRGFVVACLGVAVRRPVELGSFDPPPDLFDRLAKALAEN
jgi:hypothetical protein